MSSHQRGCIYWFYTCLHPSSPLSFSLPHILFSSHALFHLFTALLIPADRSLPDLFFFFFVLSRWLYFFFGSFPVSSSTFSLVSCSIRIISIVALLHTLSITLNPITTFFLHPYQHPTTLTSNLNLLELLLPGSLADRPLPDVFVHVVVHRRHHRAKATQSRVGDELEGSVGPVRG